MRHRVLGLPMLRLSLLLGGFLFVALALVPPGEAEEQEKLLVCGPCSSAFLPTASRVVEELGLSDRILVKRSSCLGPCAQGMVIAFRGTVYANMTEDLLRTLLENVLSEDVDG